jgi:hypothetical protein
LVEVEPPPKSRKSVVTAHTFAHRSTMSSRTRLSRTLAIVVSALCLTGQLMSAAHEATERHILCAEHGEVTHLRSESITGDTLRPNGPRGGDRIDARSAGSAGDHDHCSAVIVARRPRIDPIRVVATAPAIAPRTAPSSAPVLPPPSERILLTAPKNAPPC